MAQRAPVSRCAYCTARTVGASRIGVSGPGLAATLCSINCLVDWTEAIETRVRSRATRDGPPTWLRTPVVVGSMTKRSTVIGT